MKDMDERMEKARKVLLHGLKEQDSFMEKAIREAGMTPTCKRGCSHCCSLLTTVHVLEGLLLAEKALQLPDWRSVAMRARKASIMGRGIYAKEEYFKKGIVCPLLNTDSNDCLLYEARPITCRQHCVFSPAELCDPSNTEKPTSRFDGKLFKHATLHICHALTGTLMTASLPLMLLWCMGKLAPEKDRKLFPKLVRDLPTPTEWFKVAIEKEMQGKLTDIVRRFYGEGTTDVRGGHA
jgi:Fe-S-cluster containining protein